MDIFEKCKLLIRMKQQWNYNIKFKCKVQTKRTRKWKATDEVQIHIGEARLHIIVSMEVTYLLLCIHRNDSNKISSRCEYVTLYFDPTVQLWTKQEKINKCVPKLDSHDVEIPFQAEITSKLIYIKNLGISFLLFINFVSFQKTACIREN